MKFKGKVFNISMFRTEQGADIFSVQIRTSDDKVWKFNLGGREELCSDPKVEIVSKLMNSVFVEIETNKKPEGTYKSLNIL